MTDEYVHLSRTLFPSILVPVLGFQVAFCVGVLFWYWRGIKLMRWKDTVGEMLWEDLYRSGENAPNQNNQATQPGPVAHDAKTEGDIALQPLVQAGPSRRHDQIDRSGHRRPPQQPIQEQPPNQQSESPLPNEALPIQIATLPPLAEGEDRFHSSSRRFYLLLWRNGQLRGG